MTTPELIAYYKNLLIIQYHDKAKAKATIEALVTPVLMDQLPGQVQDAFNLDTAIGVQLDVIGKYEGVTRYVFDFSNAITLNDADFTTLIKFAIIKNNSGSSLNDIQTLFARFFPGAVSVFDHKNMSMDYFFNSIIGSKQLAEVIVREGLLPHPMGVGIGAVIYAPNLTFFGFRTYFHPGFNVWPFNDYASYDQTWTWLSYQNVL